MPHFRLSRRGVAVGLAALAATAAIGAAAAISAGSAAGTTQDTALNAAADLVATQVAADSTAPSRHRAGVALLRLAIRATLKETGLSRATVIQDLRSGQTLSSIAGSKAGAVESDVLGRVHARLDRAVAAHRITAAQEADRLAAAKTALDKLMSSNLSTRRHQRTAQAA